MTSPEYSVEASKVSQGPLCDVYVQLLVTPPIQIGDGLANMLYGEDGQMELRTIAQHPDCTHVELATSPRPGRPIRELGLMIGRFTEYLQTSTDDPENFRAFRSLPTIRNEALRSQAGMQLQD